MNILIKTSKGNDHLKAALDHASKVPPDLGDNWPYVLEQPQERFIYVTKQEPGYRIALYAKGRGLKPRVLFPYNLSARWVPMAEFSAYVLLSDDGIAISIKLNRSTKIIYGIFYLLLLAMVSYPNPANLFFAFIFIGITLPLLYSELKEGRKYFIERLTEYIGSL